MEEGLLHACALAAAAAEHSQSSVDERLQMEPSSLAAGHCAWHKAQ
jgi:hypothetical protein